MKKITNSEDVVGEWKKTWKYIVMDAKRQEYWSINLLTTQLQNVNDFTFLLNSRITIVLTWFIKFLT